MDLYYFPASNACRSVLMTGRELNVSFNLKLVNPVGGAETRTAEYRKLNPQHVIPLLDDKGFLLGESRAIMRYLVNKYAPTSCLYPLDIVTRANIDRLLDFDCGTLGSISLHLLKQKFYDGKDPTDEQISALKESMDVFEELIKGYGSDRYLTGDNLTLADLSIVSTVNVLFVLGFDVSAYPGTRAWLTNMEQLPYYNEINTVPCQITIQDLTPK